MSTFHTLPIILVSAVNEAVVKALIAELIDNDVTDEYLKDSSSSDRVWRLINKYYTADVRVHALTDGGRLDLDPDSIEAHIIYITEEELKDDIGGEGVAQAESRAAASAGVWRRVAVRLLVVPGVRAAAGLRAWAAAQRAELAPLAAPAAPPSAPFASRGGAGRARDALHAHPWRGLTRTDRTRHAFVAPRASDNVECGPEASRSSSSSSGSEDEEDAEQRAVERAEAFAAALGALGPALEGGRAAPGGEPPEARHDRAEALVAAFCRALGYDLNEC